MLMAWGGSVYTSAKKTGGRALVLFVMAAAMALATLAVFASFAEARATAEASGSFGHRPPKAVLMKGQAILQTGQLGAFCWYYYPDMLCGDPPFSYSFPRADGFLGAGSRLHVRLGKPERPETFRITAYRGFDKKRRVPIGEGRDLVRTFGRVERDGKTVGWDVFFRVNGSGRHYYLDTVGVWEAVPGTRISYGGVTYSFHVRTR